MESIAALKLSDKTLNKLAKLGYDFVWQVAMLDPWQLPKGVGQKTYDEIRMALYERGIRITR